MEESEKENLFITFQGVIESIIADKRKYKKNLDTINNLDARINLGLHVEE